MLLFFALSAAAVCILTALELSASPPSVGRWLNLQIWAIELGVRLSILPLIAVGGSGSLVDARAWPFWRAFPAFVLVIDFAEYLFHRTQHAFPFMWAMHSLHHSDSNMTATTTERHFWGEQIIKALTIWPLAFFVIRPSAGALVGYAFFGLWNYAVHSSVPFHFGKWSWALNSSAYHRRHHSSVPEHFNSNYAALLPIWDVVFGSYNRPDGFPPTGLAHRPAHVVDAVIWPLRRADRLQGGP